MQVEAAIDESDVGRLQTGQKASFNVDAFPGQTFEGSIRQVRKAATNVANVVTYVAIVGFKNEGGKLLPGMTANVRVITDQRDKVLKVPNAALRMRIEGVDAPAGGRGQGKGRVYTLGTDGKPQAVAVRIGVSDGSSTEVLESGEGAAPLAEGTEVITGIKSAPSAKPGGSGARTPF